MGKTSGSLSTVNYEPINSEDPLIDDGAIDRFYLNYRVESENIFYFISNFSIEKEFEKYNWGINIELISIPDLEAYGRSTNTRLPKSTNSYIKKEHNSAALSLSISVGIPIVTQK